MGINIPTTTISISSPTQGRGFQNEKGEEGREGGSERGGAGGRGNWWGPRSALRPTVKAPREVVVDRRRRFRIAHDVLASRGPSSTSDFSGRPPPKMALPRSPSSDPNLRKLERFYYGLLGCASSHDCLVFSILYQQKKSSKINPLFWCLKYELPNPFHSFLLVSFAKLVINIKIVPFFFF